MSAANQAIETLLHDGDPSWDAIDFEIACPRCGYNLRLLTRPRCPECGLDFKWRAVLDRAAWRSDFLFEHHWRASPVRSWLTTVWRSLRPLRFWRQVSIHDRIHVGPLWFMLLFAVVVFCILLHATAYFLSPGAEAIDRHTTGGTGAGPYGEVSRALLAVARLPLDAGWIFCMFPGAMLLILLVALALLASLRQTLGRCRVRLPQILRVGAYGATPACAILGLGFTLLFAWRIALAAMGWPTTVEVSTWAGFLSPPIVMGIYICTGLKCYLRLPRSILLGLTAVGVGFLFTFTTFLVTQLVAAGAWG